MSLQKVRIGFDEAYARLMLAEKGFTKDPKDPGNWTTGRVGAGELKGTKGGISAATYPDLDIENLTPMQIRNIYYRDWWQRVGGGEIDPAIIYQLWQFAVNAGMSTARRCLQRAVRVADDGVIGPITLVTIKRMDLDDVLMRLLAQEIRHYTSLRQGFVDFGRGWMNRVADQLDYAAIDNIDEGPTNA